MEMVHGVKTQSHIRSSYYMRSPFYPSHDEQAALLEDRRNRLAEEGARASPPQSPTDAANNLARFGQTYEAVTPTRPCICQGTPPRPRDAATAGGGLYLTPTSSASATPDPKRGRGPYETLYSAPNGSSSASATPDTKRANNTAKSGKGLSSYEMYVAREAQALTFGASRLMIGASPNRLVTGPKYVSSPPRQPRAITGRRGSMGGGSCSTPGSSTHTSASTSTSNLNDTEAAAPSAISVLTTCALAAGPDTPAPTFSRKVFVGGLPIDIIDDDITRHFVTYGSVKVDWPHKVESKAVFPPKGFAFLHFKAEPSVKALLEASTQEDGHFFSHVLSPRGGWKRVEIIPWLLQDADYSTLAVEELDARKTVFVGGVPRPCTASKLASIMDSLFGSVVYAGIDTDLEFQYPKGSGRVCFSSKNSFVNAISSRFVEVIIGNSKKRVEIKPYILDEQVCDICHGANTEEQFAAFYCNHVGCLKYHCSQCWAKIHCLPEYKFHKPLIKEARSGLHDMTM